MPEEVSFSVMSLPLLLGLPMVLLAVGVYAITASRRPGSGRWVYGISLSICAMLLGIALAHLLGGQTSATLALPLGLPWLGAHFRLDALAAFSWSWSIWGALSPACSPWAMANTSARPSECCRFFQHFWPA